MVAGTVMRPRAHIPGQRCNAHLEEAMQSRVSKIMGTRPRDLPASQPVSFSQKSLQDLTDFDYFLCEKSDGIRVLLFCTKVDNKEMQFFIDRKNNYYQLSPMHFPSITRRGECHIDSLVDGELVVDMATQTDKPRLTYLAFDCMVLEGENITHRSFDKRLGKLKDSLIKPYEMSKPRTDPGFSVQLKSMQRSYGVAMMFDQILPNLIHDNDGLIFTRRDAPYQVGTDENIVKWKHADENSIDFRLKLGPFPNPNSRGFSHEKPSLDLYIFLGRAANRSPYDFYAPLSITDQEWETLKGLNQVLDGRVLECVFSSVDRQWHYKAYTDGMPIFRDDKPEANHIVSTKKIWKSIQDGITSKELIDRSDLIKKGWKEREARQASGPPPPSRH